MTKVFISYRKADFREVEKLAHEIRAAGHEVWIDEWKIELGDSVIAEINEGLGGADYVIVCYSSEGILSAWMSREWMSALARQLNGANVRVLPALLTAGEPPSILADIKYADLVTDWPQGVKELLQAIKGNYE